MLAQTSILDMGGHHLFSPKKGVTFGLWRLHHLLQFHTWGDSVDTSCIYVVACGNDWLPFAFTSMS